MKSWPLYIAVAALFLALVSGSLTTTGMFMDGLIYSNVAANMADGIGSFWHPVYTASYHPDFYQHPPLALGMMALFYKVLGTHLWVTKVYMALTILLCAWLTFLLWIRLGGKRDNGWMPLLLWTLIPIVTHFANQCMLENTMVLFDLGAILLLLQPNRKSLNGFLSGLLLAAAFLTKGFPGLFPLVLPVLLWFYDRKGGRIMQLFYLLAGVFIPLAVIAMTVPQARVYFENYLQLQVLAGWSQYEEPRWQILVYFLRNTVIVIGLTLLLVLLNKGVRKKNVPTYGVMWVLVACGVLPIMVSTRQHDYYLITVMPLVAALLALLIEEPLERWIMPNKAMPYVASAMMIGALTLNIVRYGDEGRDAQLQRDMKVIVAQLDEGETVTIPSPLYYDYKLQGYYYRERRITLDDQHRCRHLLTTAEYPADIAYRELPLPTKEYKLYEQITETI